MPEVRFKICSRCLFRVPGRKSACHTCGSTTFSGEVIVVMPGKDGDEHGPADMQPAARGSGQSAFDHGAAGRSVHQNSAPLTNPYLSALAPDGFISRNYGHAPAAPNAQGHQGRSLALPQQSNFDPPKRMYGSYTHSSQHFQSNADPSTKQVGGLRGKFCEQQDEPRPGFLEEPWQFIKRTFTR